MQIQALVVTPDAGERAHLSHLFEPAAGDKAIVILRFAASLGEAARNPVPVPDLLVLLPMLGASDNSLMFPDEESPFNRVPVMIMGDAIGIAYARGALTTGLADDLLLASDTRAETLDRIIAAVYRGRAWTQRKISGDIVLAAMADGVIITDAAGRVCYCNNAAYSLAARHHGEVLGLLIEEVMPLHDAKTKKAMEHPVVRVLRTKQITRLPPGTVMVRADGSEIMIADSTSPILGSNGSVDGAVIVFHDITASHALQSQLDYLAKHDFLTGLPNRFTAQQHLTEMLCQASEHGQSLAVMYLDLDNFKEINDTLGHAAGDELLVSVAARLRSCCRSIDLISRQGGDEFLILMAPGTNASETTGAAQRILKAVARPHGIAGKTVLVGCSIGIALHPEHGKTGETLLQHADTALHAAKAAGRNTYCFFHGDMLNSVIRRRTLENALRLALDTDGFDLFYQPKVSLASGAILGSEALLRWQHPDWRGLSPGDMVRCAEQSGLIVALGRWVLREAVRQARRWQDSGHQAGPIAINVSALELRQADFVEHLQRCCDEHGILPSIMQIEVTESVLMRDVGSAVDVLHRLKAMGMSLAIDDFGTGYSNLSYLADFPVDVLKVDRSFVHGIADGGPRRQSLLRAVLSIASNLGLPTVAEGIETSDEASYLINAGCHLGQGFHYSPPVSAAAFEHLVAC